MEAENKIDSIGRGQSQQEQITLFFEITMRGRDDSFKKPGTVPFKWEVKPGVPKSPLDQPPGIDHHRSLPTTPRRLAPPPSADIGSQSFRSATSVRSHRHRLEPKPRAPALAHPLVVSAGCLLSPLFRRKWGRKKKVAPKASPEDEPDQVSERATIGTLPRCSSSTRNSFSSRRSSSCQLPVRDPEWVGFGLF